MSTLYLGSDPHTLAARMADVLATSSSDPFEPIEVIVPNRYIRKWLRLWLARRLGVTFNLQFHDLEDALWLLLRQLDPRASLAEPEPLDDNTQRLAILAVL